MNLHTFNPSISSSLPSYSLIVKSSQTPSIHTWVTELVLFPDPSDSVVDFAFAFVNNN